MSVTKSRRARPKFIIEAGAQGEGNATWRSFFRIEQHGTARRASKRIFLDREFISPEVAIQAALVEARRKIEEDLASSDARSQADRKPA